MPVDINHWLVTESGRITYDIYQRTFFTSPWLHLPRKVAWPHGMGDVISNVMWERPHVGTVNDWEPVRLNTGSGSSCIPPADLVEFHQTLRAIGLEHKAVHSPRFCVNDFMFTAKRERQMAAIVKSLSEVVRTYWIDFNQRRYTEWGNKYVIEPGLAHTDEYTTQFPAIQPTSILTQGVLDYFYNLLILEQAGQHALTFQNGRPIFGLITDQLTARRLIRQDPDIREDFRYSSRKDELLRPLGVTHTYNGYVYMIDDMPPRYNFDSNQVESGSDDPSTDPWTQVPRYVLDTSDPANPKTVVNPAWLTAEYQDSWIYVRDAYQLRVPGQVTGVGPADFKPRNYMGDFKFLNIVNDDESSDAYNPDGIMGRFRGVLLAGVEGINPHVMFTLRHRVCPTDLGLLGCDDDGGSD